ncbi:MAG: spinocerebellar ataxia type 10 protein domain-containing protein [Benniella sp.]|nr:MAG: spinocerebellar ataxia type 10 protein domain-containing protein [Benniella sp.]
MSSDLLVNTLQSLAKAGTTGISQDHLEAIAKKLQVDADFRIELSHLTGVWNDIAVILGRVVQDGLSPTEVDQLVLIFRIVRNGVAGVVENQDLARDANIPNLIQEIVSYAAHTHYGNTTYILMLRVGVQALSNLLTGNNLSKDHVWKSLIVQAPSRNCDQNLLSTLAAIEDETIVLGTVMLCYNCIFESNERSTLLITTPAGRKLLAQLANESHASSNKEERKSFEMIYTLFKHLIDMGLFKELFGAMDSDQESTGAYEILYHGENFYSEGEKASKVESAPDQKDRKQGRSHLSVEQVILLKMIDSLIYTHHQQPQQRQEHGIGESSSEAGSPVSKGTVAFLTRIFAMVSASTIEVFKSLDRPGVGQHGVEDLANLSSGVMLLLGCFAHLSLYEDGHVSNAQVSLNQNGIEGEIERQGKRLPVPEWFKIQHATMVHGEIVENAIELLRQADTSLARVNKPASSNHPVQTGSPAAPSTATRSMGANMESTLLSNTSTAQGQQSFFVGLKRDIVRLVGNLAYHSRDVQDRIRSCNGLVVMLSQCNIDDANPFLREYGILAMRNILEENAENQAIIAELQPIEAVDHPVLQEARLQAQLDAQTGRPVLTQRKD